MVLGPLEVRTDAGEARPVRGGRSRALLHLLVMHQRVVVPVEVVADRLWQGNLPHDGANAVHQLVSYLRRALGPEGKHQLVTSPVGYRLDAADESVDAWLFDTLLQRATIDALEGSATSAHRVLAAAEQAARLWRGEPYQESAGYEWAAGDITRLKEGYLQLQETRLDAALLLGHHREVVLDAQSLAAAYPLREQFHAQHALALYRSGRQSEALETFRRVRDLLADELGLDPGAQLQELEHRILQHDPELEWRLPADRAPVAVPPPPPPAATVQRPESAEPVFPGTPPPPRAPNLHGRDADVVRLGDLLVAGAAVTLTGPAGIGKSALARTIARSGRHQPVWYVDLSDVERPGLTATVVARQLGFSGQLPADPTGIVASGFRGAAGLLVVDACERLLPDVTAVVDAVRRAAPGITVLTTSRRPLGLENEAIHRLSPLTVPGEGGGRSWEELAGLPSVALFCERAVRVRSDFRLDSANADDVAEIVRAMEGLPLGIELAAANADVLDARGIRERLHQLLSAADGSIPASPHRPRSLTAALDSSCVLLTPVEQRVLGALAVFRGAFDLEAVHAVVELDGSDAYPVLASLVRQSMVSHEGAQTYRLLRPLRDYVADKVPTGAVLDEVRRRHAAYVRSATERASRDIRTATTAALSRLHRLLPDARAAMAWSLATATPADAADIGVAYTWYWAINGQAEEGMRWLSAVADATEGSDGSGVLDPRREAAVLRSLALLCNPTGAVRRAVDLCRRSLLLSRAVGDDPGTTAALLTQGIGHWAVGDFAAAAAAHDEAHRLATRTGERWHLLSALTLRARTALDAGEADALDRIEAAVAVGQEQGDGQMLSISMTLLARHQLAAGELEAAALAAGYAAQHAAHISYFEGELSALNVLGRIRLTQGLVGDATACFVQALRGAVDIGHRGSMCESLESLALTAAASGRSEQAHLLLAASGRERNRLGLRIPAADAAAVTEAAATTAAVLGAATSLIEARAKWVPFDELVRELLAARLTDDGRTAPAALRRPEPVDAAPIPSEHPIAAVSGR
jgi:predicted ATPase/DNA-binding SARP family transcriptional activator